MEENKITQSFLDTAYNVLAGNVDTFHEQAIDEYFDMWLNDEIQLEDTALEGIAELYKLFENNDILFNLFNNHYSYMSLANDTIGLHTTYYAYYVLIAIVFLVYFLFQEKRTRKGRCLISFSMIIKPTPYPSQEGNFYKKKMLK